MSDYIRICEVEKYYGSASNVTRAVDRVSFQVDKGEFVGVMGPSGSGKTTLLNMLATIDRVTAGHIYYESTDITELSEDALSDFRRDNLGFVFQEYNLLDTLTIRENISLALTINRVPAGKIMERVEDMADKLGIRDIQSRLSKAKGRVEYILNDTNNADPGLVQTTRDELLAFQQTMANDLNAQYQDFYIYGGNDVSTAPFSLSADGKTLTYTHRFSGDTETTKMVMTLTKQADGSYKYEFSGSKGSAALDEDQTLNAIVRSMKEQGRMDIGYGTISDRETLMDTYTGGLNAITGLSSDAVRAMDQSNPTGLRNQIKDLVNNSPIGLVGRAVQTVNGYMDGGSKTEFSESLGAIMDTMTVSEHRLSTVYSDLGNKYAILENVEDKLTTDKVSLTEQYKNKLGADPYDSIIEMYSYQQSYQAALKVGSYMIGTSLFDFMR